MQTFIRKISSRKLWIAIVGVVVGLAAAFGIDESEYASVVGVIGAIASCVSYIIGEAKIDAAGAEGRDIYYETTVSEADKIGETSLIGTQDPELGDDGK